MRGGKTTLWRGGFFFCRFIGLERRVHHGNVLCGLARCFSSGYGKRTEQSAIWLLRMAVRWQWRKRAESSADKGLSFQSWQSPKKKITVEKTGKTIRDCRDKHQGTYLNGMAHGKFRMQAKLRVTAQANVFRLSFPALRFLYAMQPAGVSEREREQETGTDRNRLQIEKR